jgi:hypothetical protein
MARSRASATGKAVAMLGVPSDYDPEENDFEGQPPAKPKASRKRKRRCSTVAATAIASGAVASASAASATAVINAVGVAFRARLSTVVAQRGVSPLQRPSPRVVSRAQSSTCWNSERCVRQSGVICTKWQCAEPIGLWSPTRSIDGDKKQRSAEATSRLFRGDPRSTEWLHLPVMHRTCERQSQA